MVVRAYEEGSGNGTTQSGARKGWSPPGGTAPQQKPSSTSTSLTNAQKAVWFMRPAPIPIGTSDLYGTRLHDPSQPLFNNWYDKADVNSAWTALTPEDQNLYWAVAKSISSRKTGPGLFTDTVDQSAYQSTQGLRVTPQQIMRQQALQFGLIDEAGMMNVDRVKALAAGGGGGGGGGAKYGTTTDRSTVVPDTDPDTAKTLVNQALSTYLGKEASPEQLQRFIANLQQHESANPSVTSRTTTTSPGGSVSSQKSTGGINAQQYAADWARAQEGSAEYQAATTYMDAFMKAVQNPSDVVQ
jgi:hypothetical protein